MNEAGNGGRVLLEVVAEQDDEEAVLLLVDHQSGVVVGMRGAVLLENRLELAPVRGPLVELRFLNGRERDLVTHACPGVGADLAHPLLVGTQAEHRSDADPFSDERFERWIRRRRRRNARRRHRGRDIRGRGRAAGGDEHRDGERCEPGSVTVHVR
jgi:hypothetical protein